MRDDIKHGLPPVEGTLRRKGGYSSNLRIDPVIRDQYAGQEHHRKSLRTSDPKVARKEVRRVQVELDDAIAKAKAAQMQETLLGSLSEDQRRLFFAAGGLPGLLESFQRSQESLIFRQAGDPAHRMETDEEIHPMQLKMEIAEHQASVAVTMDHARAEAKTLKALGQPVDVPGGDVTGLRELADAYFEAKGTEPTGRRTYGRAVRRFIELHGDIPLRDLTMDHLRVFANEIKRLTGSIKGGANKLTFHENAKRAATDGLPLLSENEQRTAVSHLRYLTAFAPGQGYLDRDPWAGFKIIKVKRKFSEARHERDPFSGDEVAAIIEFARENRHPQSIDHWAPLLGAYQGARREEIAQVLVKDVCQLDGEWVMRITDEGEDQKVKNRSSLRNMPIHPTVVAAGFLDFVQARQAAPDDYLFREEVRKGTGQLQDLSLDSDKRISGKYGKRFAADLTTLKIKRRGLVFHSFRHTWETAADHTEMAAAHRRGLSGRASEVNDSADRYGDGPSIRQGREALAKIDPLTVVTGQGMKGDR